MSPEQRPVSRAKPVSAGDVLRSVRRAARLSQRELAERASLPRSTVGRIESAISTDPKLGTFLKLLVAGSCGLVVVGADGQPIDVRSDPRGEAVEQHRDAIGRRMPAHLQAFPIMSEGDGWWGWRRIAWQPDDPGVPAYGYWQRGPAERRESFRAAMRWWNAT